MAAEVIGPHPTQVAVQLTPKSVDALRRASRAAGLTHTDTVNRAVQLYDFVLAALDENPDNALVVVRNGRAEQIQLR